MTQEPPSNFEMCQVATKGRMKDESETRKSDLRLDKYLRKSDSSFYTELPEELSPKLLAIHAPDAKTGLKHPYRRWYQLPHAEGSVAKWIYIRLAKEKKDQEN